MLARFQVASVPWEKYAVCGVVILLEPCLKHFIYIYAGCPQNVYRL